MTGKAPTTRELLHTIIATTIEAAPDGQFDKEAFRGVWTREAGTLDGLARRAHGSKDDALIRDAEVHNLLISIRALLSRSHLMNDESLQEASGSNVLDEYRNLNRDDPHKYPWHTIDGIIWTDKELSELNRIRMNVDPSSRRTKTWKYLSSWDHAITNLFCKVWGLSELGWMPWIDKPAMNFFKAEGPNDRSYCLALLLGARKDISHEWERMKPGELREFTVGSFS